MRLEAEVIAHAPDAVTIEPDAPPSAVATVTASTTTDAPPSAVVTAPPAGDDDDPPESVQRDPASPGSRRSPSMREMFLERPVKRQTGTITTILIMNSWRPRVCCSHYSECWFSAVPCGAFFSIQVSAPPAAGDNASPCHTTHLPSQGARMLYARDCFGNTTLYTCVATGVSLTLPVVLLTASGILPPRFLFYYSNLVVILRCCTYYTPFSTTDHILSVHACGGSKRAGHLHEAVVVLGCNRHSLAAPSETRVVGDSSEVSSSSHVDSAEFHLEPDVGF